MPPRKCSPRWTSIRLDKESQRRSKLLKAAQTSLTTRLTGEVIPSDRPHSFTMTVRQPNVDIE
jgi:hypothetical protein